MTRPLAKENKELPQLVAPRDLVGPVHKKTPQNLKDKRVDWINTQLLMGYSDGEIAAALRVSCSSVCHFMRKRNMARRFWMAKYGRDSQIEVS